MTRTPPPRRDRPVIPTNLFPTLAAAFERPDPAPTDPVRRSLNLWPYVVIHLYADGTGGAEAPIATARWERVIQSAQDHRDKLQADLEFVEKWLVAKKLNRIDLKV